MSSDYVVLATDTSCKESKRRDTLQRIAECGTMTDEATTGNLSTPRHESHVWPEGEVNACQARDARSEHAQRMLGTRFDDRRQIPVQNSWIQDMRRDEIHGAALPFPYAPYNHFKFCDRIRKRASMCDA